MKNIRIWFSDFSSDFNVNDNQFVNILKKRYNIILDSKSPDYLFYSNFGQKYLDYDCIRIFYTGECIVPDFNLCDYAMAFDRLQFGDRYLKLPLYRLFQYRRYYDMLFEKKTIDNPCDRNFCSFVCSNCFADDIRSKMFLLLSEYKKVDSGGRYMNNIGGPVKDKFEFQTKHKFAIAFENGSYDGYATEKLVDALASGVVPIYYGDPNIHLDFNESSFINGHRYDSLQSIVERVKELDNNDELYREVLNSNPIITDMRDDHDLKDFLYNICDCDISSARRRPASSYAADLEKYYIRYGVSERWIFSKIERLRKLLYRIKNNAI